MAADGQIFDADAVRRISRIVRDAERVLYSLRQQSPTGGSLAEPFSARIVEVSALPEAAEPAEEIEEGESAPGAGGGEYTGKILDPSYLATPIEIKFIHVGEDPAGELLLALEDRVVVYRIAPAVLTELGFTPVSPVPLFCCLAGGSGDDDGGGDGAKGEVEVVKVTSVPSPSEYQPTSGEDELASVDDTANTITATAHVFTDGERVTFTTDDALPAPLLEGTTYFVRDASGTTCKVSATDGGAAINLTDDGTGTHTVHFTATPPRWPIYTGKVLNKNYDAEDDPETEETEEPDEIDFVNLLDYPGKEALLRVDDIVAIFRVPSDTLQAVGIEKNPETEWEVEDSTFTADATANTITASIAFEDGEQVKVSSSGTLPGGLSDGNTYYVRDVATTTCKLATSQGGTAIDLSSAGTGTHTVEFVSRQISVDWASVDLGHRQQTLMVKVVSPYPDNARDAYTGAALNQEYAGLEVKFFHLGEEADGSKLLKLADIVPVWLVPNDTLTTLGFDPDEDEPLNYSTVQAGGTGQPDARLAQILTTNLAHGTYDLILLDEKFGGAGETVIHAVNLAEGADEGPYGSIGEIVAVFEASEESLDDLGFDTDTDGPFFGFIRRKAPPNRLHVQDNYGNAATDVGGMVFNGAGILVDAVIPNDPNGGNTVQVILLFGAEAGTIAAGDDARFGAQVHSLLDAYDGEEQPGRHNDVEDSAAGNGDLIVRNADHGGGPTWVVLSGSTATTGAVLQFDAGIAAPHLKWATIVHTLLDGNKHTDTKEAAPEKGRLIAGDGDFWDALGVPKDDGVPIDGLVLITDDSHGLGHVYRGFFHALLDGDVHPDTKAAAPSKGRMMAGDGSFWDVLAPGTNDHVLTADSTSPLGVKWAAAAGGGGGMSVDWQYFSSSGTWTKPANAKLVRVVCVGGGGAGGSGRRGATNTVRFGGGGGGPGQVIEHWFEATQLSATETITIGSAAAGGTAITANNTNGNDGAPGAAACFGGTTFAGSKLAAAGGGFGGGGGPGGSVGTPGSGWTTFTASNQQYQPDGGSGAGQQGGASSKGPGSGGGGGEINASNIGNAGGSGGANNLTFYTNSLGGGGTAGGAGSNGSAGPNAAATDGSSRFLFGAGGGGGGGHPSNPGGNGGAGGNPGGGGGGGGGALNGNSSGAGGNGGAGAVYVITYI